MSAPVTPETLTDEMVIAFLNGVMTKIRATKSAESTYEAYFQLTSLRYHCLVTLKRQRANRGGSRAKSRDRVAAAINAARTKETP